MLAFDVLFPDLARQEARAFTVIEQGVLPPGTYVLRENYCTDHGCDCRRVLIQVFEAGRNEQVATINYAFEPPKPPHDDEDQLFLDPINPQSNLSEGMLAVIGAMISDDAAFRARLIRHYELWKGVVDDPSHPDHTILRRTPGFDYKALWRSKVGAYELCPCGSGRKFKWCCSKPT